MEVTDAPLRTSDLYRFYRAGEEETLALRGVSVQVHAGELVAVAGPSGSGKSTLLACLAGLEEPDGGTVWVAGKRLSGRPETERAAARARHIGLLFQTSNLLAHLSVADNVALVQRLARRGWGASPDDLLCSLGIGHRSHALPGELSGGETARAGLAVALANDPELVLADEPTGELDRGSEDDVLSLLRARADSGRGVLIASHSPAVAAVADRVVRLDDGRLVA
jgi:putative ABC transport system ATP-binding protein